MALAKGTGQLGVGIDLELLAAVKAFAEARGQTLRHVVERAIRRDMANPPPIVPEPPLPDAPPEVVPVKPRARTPARKA